MPAARKKIVLSRYRVYGWVPAFCDVEAESVADAEDRALDTWEHWELGDDIEWPQLHNHLADVQRGTLDEDGEELDWELPDLAHVEAAQLATKPLIDRVWLEARTLADANGWDRRLVLLQLQSALDEVRNVVDVDPPKRARRR